jgi:hypothetical protein
MTLPNFLVIWKPELASVVTDIKVIEPRARPASLQLPSEVNSADQATSLPCCGKGSTGPISNSQTRCRVP